MSPRTQPINIGINPNDEPISYDQILHGHLAVAGPTGSGKSKVLHALGAAAIKQQQQMLHIMAPKGGASYGSLKAISLVSSPDASTGVMSALAADVRRRHETMATHEVEHVNDLPVSVRPVPAVLLIDEIEWWLKELPTPNSTFVESLRAVLRDGQAAGVTVITSCRIPQPFHRGATILLGVVGPRFGVFHEDEDSAPVLFTIPQL